MVGSIYICSIWFQRYVFVIQARIRLTHGVSYFYSVYFYRFQANTDGPEFSTTYNNTEQKIDVTFTSLEVLLHQEALLHVLELVEKLKPAPKAETAIKSSEEEKDKEKTEEKKEEVKKTVKSKISSS